MTKTKNTKKSLLASMISLLVCVAMLIGSTFAWFTDSVTSGRNQIVAGNLDVELYHSNAKVENEKVEETTPLFRDKDGGEMKWEPGVITYENFKAENVGTLALKYKLALSIMGNNTVTVDGVKKSLADVIKVAFYKGEFSGEREAALGLTYGDLSDMAKSGVLMPSSKAPEDVEQFAIVLYWKPTDNDNDYNLNNGREADDTTGSLYIDLGVKLTASQYTYEKDSFNDQYDFDAMDDDKIHIPDTTDDMDIPAGERPSGELNFNYPYNAPLPAGEEGDTKIEIPADAITLSGSDGHTIKCQVETAYKDYTTIPGNEKVGVATIDVLLFVDGAQIHELNGKATITTKIMPGLSGVEVVYNGAGAAPELVKYDPATGELIFTTTHFSKFSVRAKDNRIASADALKEALGDITAGNEASLSLVEDMELNENATLAGNGAIDLNGHNLTVKNSSGKGISVAPGASLKFTDSSKDGKLILDTAKSSNQAIYAAGSSNSKKASVTFEDIDISVENTAHGSYSGTYASGNYSAVYAGKYTTVTFGEGTVVTAKDEKSLQCDAYVAYADGSSSVLNIDGAKVTADGTVTPFATGNGTINMTSGNITISSNNGCAALMVARGSGEINMSGGTIEVTGDVSGGRGGAVYGSWGNYFKDYCFGIATTWTADDDEAVLTVTGGTIELTPTAGIAVGVALVTEQAWSRGYVRDNAVINCKAAQGATARAVGAVQGSPLGIEDNAVTDVFPTGGDNDLIADEYPFTIYGAPVRDDRTNH